jgi:hypothetical protein
MISMMMTIPDKNDQLNKDVYIPGIQTSRNVPKRRAARTMASPLPPTFQLPLLLLLAAVLAHSGSNAVAQVFPVEARPTSSGYLPVDASANASLFFAF